MFVGRQKELAVLQEAYGSDRFEMLAVYGRRRVGKTLLLRAFAAEKPDTYFFTAQQTMPEENLARLSAVLAKGAGASGPEFFSPGTYPVYQSFEAALRSVFEESLGRRVLLVIDEYPYLAEGYSGISSVLQALIDQYQQRSKLMIVLCGSSMSFMESQVLGEKSPLYGRRTGQIRVVPFDFSDAATLLGTGDAVRAMELYGIAGGVPLYLDQLDSARNLEWNISKRVLRVGAFLEAETENFLLQELRSPGRYNAVLAALASGRNTPKEIADQTAIPAANVQQALQRLEELTLVRRVTPAVKAKSRQVRYEIADNLFRFSYRFKGKYETPIEMGLSDEVARRIVADEFSTYMGPVFEDVCRQWLVNQAVRGCLPLLPVEVGRWWGTNPRERREEEIDVVVRGADGELVLGECKWNSRPVDASVIGVLRRRAELLPGGGDAQLFVFSKSGFEEECRARAAEVGNVRLVTAEEMLR